MKRKPIMYDVFLICPVRNSTEEQKQRMQNYVADLENSGEKVYYPNRDTDQVDAVGYRICTDNKIAIQQAKEIHIFWDNDSKGSLFDLGIAFALDKPLVIVNKNEVIKTNCKSFANMIMTWAKEKNK